jgi:sodium-dependent phosphate cotransporter
MPGVADKADATKEEEVEEQGWDVEFSDDSGDTRGSAELVITNLFKCCLVFGALYIFICALSFLADGFRLVAGKNAGEVFQNSEIFNNEFAGCMVGLLVTVLVQSSSTSTSIIITMVAADLLTVRQAIPMVMGCNMGTSVTSTIVAMGQVGNRDEFRRAFAAATVHDMFNILSVVVLLPIEAATGFLFELSYAIVKSQNLMPEDKPPDMLKVLTNPLTKSVIEIDKKLMTKIAVEKNATKLAALYEKSMIKGVSKSSAHLAGTSMSDESVGILLLFGALAGLCLALFVIVRLLKSMLKGKVAVWLHKSVNGEVPDFTIGGIKIYMGWLAGYLAMGAGAGLTIMVQSSSITTSALTPLVGLGVISIDRMYPVVLGANIGTCVTGLLAALAASASKLQFTLQVAYAHLFFNISGIILWYCIWPNRQLPISLAKALGNVVHDYRWFAIFYIFVIFFVTPAVFVALSIAGPAAIGTVLTLCILAGIFIIALTKMQAKCPDCLPEVLQTWEFMPSWLRSLEPWDRNICGPIWEAHENRKKAQFNKSMGGEGDGNSCYGGNGSKTSSPVKHGDVEEGLEHISS